MELINGLEPYTCFKYFSSAYNTSYVGRGFFKATKGSDNNFIFTLIGRV